MATVNNPAAYTCALTGERSHETLGLRVCLAGLKEGSSDNNPVVTKGIESIFSSAA